MNDDKMTPGDVKLVPKVTVEQALKVLEADVSALLEKTIKGFELHAGDTKSRKRIFGAFVTAGARFMVSSEALSIGSLARRASRAVSSLYPKASPIPDDNGYDGEGDDADE